MGEADSEAISNGILVLLLVLFLSMLGGHILRRYKVQWMTEAGIATILGIICGGFIEILGEASNLKSVTQLNVEFFLLFLLPPIIFESGYNMDTQTFFTYFGPICAYAFLGTFLSTFIISSLIFISGQIFNVTSLTLSESFAFGTLISATDPVSVLSIMKDLNADKKLYTLIFGESIFNDAVTIALYRAVIAIQMSTGGSYIILSSAGQFLIVFFGSFMVGAILALIVSYILKLIKSGYGGMNFEAATVIFGPWISYLVSEALSMSGIVSILFCGIFMARYTYPNLSNMTKEMVAKAYNVVAHSAEVLVFIFLGMGVFSFNLPYAKMGVGLFILTFLFINFGRAVNVIANSWMLKSFGMRVPSKFQFIMWFSGLRGAIGNIQSAFALAIRSLHDFEEGNGDVILTLTLIYALITIVFIAGGITPLLLAFDVIDNGQILQEDRGDKCSQIMHWLTILDSSYIYPYVVGSRSAIEYEVQDPESSIELT